MLNLTRQERIALLFVAALLILGAGINHSLKRNPAWLKSLGVQKETLKTLAVDINSATEEDLIAVPGIGPVTAASIISYRLANGRFKSIDDLDKIKGIGPKKLSQMSQYLLCH